MQEQIKPSIVKNNGFYEKGTLSQENFNKIWKKCSEIIGEHITIKEKGDQYGDAIYTPIEYRDKKGNIFNGEIVFSDEMWTRKSTQKNPPIEQYTSYRIFPSKEEGKCLYFFGDSYKKGSEPGKFDVIRITNTPEELEKAFDDINTFLELLKKQEPSKNPGRK